MGYRMVLITVVYTRFTIYTRLVTFTWVTPDLHCLQRMTPVFFLPVLRLQLGSDQTCTSNIGSDRYNVNVCIHEGGAICPHIHNLHMNLCTLYRQCRCYKYIHRSLYSQSGYQYHIPWCRITSNKHYLYMLCPCH